MQVAAPCSNVPPAQPQCPPQFELPPETMEYRMGVNENVTKAGKIEVTKQFWKEHVSSMHTGRVAECFDAWLDENIMWHTSARNLPVHTKGKIEVCKMYNIVQRKIMGGEQSTVSMRVNDVTYHPKTDAVKLDFTSSVLLSGAVVPTVEEIRFTIKYNDKMRINRVVVSPADDFIIRPVHTKNEKEEEEEEEEDEERSKTTTETDDSTYSEEFNLPLLPPTTSRPCNHNNWDPVRVKRRTALLRCRVCVSQWKLPVGKVTRCPKYVSPDGCGKGSLCNSLHVNMRKLTYEERTGTKQQSE
eukprot:TRINITY_DN1316_c2_g1_i3.p1 TRINITY_DN1316_c2_g1~~TRINITY_DN1316_c2_g1_i3.p1  ORF type:complete len:300 (+),score=53.78 TRINITY_DN1316_c2_g1_i3:104-1003(+)